MEIFDKSMNVLNELFGCDFQFALATVMNGNPSVRVVDTYYENGVFWVVTYRGTTKSKGIETNPNVALCNQFYNFKGNAMNTGHPLKEENKSIREKLIKVFEPWYFAHNNEKDEGMCYIKIMLTEGFFHKDGMGYKVNFTNKTAEEFPFNLD